jgi:hypothetical protein
MVIVNWKYINEPYIAIEEDKFYCHILNRVVDLGWSDRENLVVTWVSSLNSVAASIYKKFKKTVNKIKLTKNTFDKLQVIRCCGYNFEKNKLGHYEIELVDYIEDDEVLVCSNNSVEGKINIIV